MIEQGKDIVDILFGFGEDGKPSLLTGEFRAHIIKDGKPIAGFTVQQIAVKGSAKIGDDADTFSYEEAGKKYRFAFAKVESIDILINALQTSKTFLINEAKK